MNTRCGFCDDIFDEDYADRFHKLTFCQHLIHKTCLSEMINRFDNTFCPTCKMEFSKEFDVSKYKSKFLQIMYGIPRFTYTFLNFEIKIAPSLSSWKKCRCRKIHVCDIDRNTTNTNTTTTNNNNYNNKNRTSRRIKTFKMWQILLAFGISQFILKHWFPKHITDSEIYVYEQIKY